MYFACKFRSPLQDYQTLVSCFSTFCSFFIYFLSTASTLITIWWGTDDMHHIRQQRGTSDKVEVQLWYQSKSKLSMANDIAELSKFPALLTGSGQVSSASRTVQAWLCEAGITRSIADRAGVSGCADTGVRTGACLKTCSTVLARRSGTAVLKTIQSRICFILIV